MLLKYVFRSLNFLFLNNQILTFSGVWYFAKPFFSLDLVYIYLLAIFMAFNIYSLRYIYIPGRSTYCDCVLVDYLNFSWRIKIFTLAPISSVCWSLYIKYFFFSSSFPLIWFRICFPYFSVLLLCFLFPHIFV